MVTRQQAETLMSSTGGDEARVAHLVHAMGVSLVERRGIGKGGWELAERLLAERRRVVEATHATGR